MGNIFSGLSNRIQSLSKKQMAVMCTALGMMVTLLLSFNCFHEWKTVEAYSRIAYGYNEEPDREDLVKVINIQPEKKDGDTQILPENKELSGDTLAGVAREKRSIQEVLDSGQLASGKKVMEMMEWGKDSESSIKAKYPFNLLNVGTSGAKTEESQSENEEVEQQNREILEEKKAEEKIKKAAKKSKAEKKAAEPKIHLSKQDKSVLLRIVEAEATDEDVKGRMLVANVVLNRVNCKTEFANNVTDVVFERTNGVYQFSPIQDGRYWSVSISEKTKTAVERVLNGEDYSEGALYFMARKYADSDNVAWFDNSLTWLFAYGQHEFFK